MRRTLRDDEEAVKQADLERDKEGLAKLRIAIEEQVRQDELQRQTLAPPELEGCSPSGKEGEPPPPPLPPPPPPDRWQRYRKLEFDINERVRAAELRDKDTNARRQRVEGNREEKKELERKRKLRKQRMQLIGLRKGFTVPSDKLWYKFEVGSRDAPSLWGYQFTVTAIFDEKPTLEPEIVSKLREGQRVCNFPYLYESAHPYRDFSKYTRSVSVPGAETLVVVFAPQCEVEEEHDCLEFFDCDPTGRSGSDKTEIPIKRGGSLLVPGETGAQGKLHQLNGTVRGRYWPLPHISIPGSQAYYRFYSDYSVSKWGYKFAVIGLNGKMTKKDAVARAEAALKEPGGCTDWGDMLDRVGSAEAAGDDDAAAAGDDGDIDSKWTLAIEDALGSLEDEITTERVELNSRDRSRQLLRELHTLRCEFKGVRDALADQSKNLKRRQTENTPSMARNVDGEAQLMF